MADQDGNASARGHENDKKADQDESPPIHHKGVPHQHAATTTGCGRQQLAVGRPARRPGGSVQQAERRELALQLGHLSRQRRQKPLTLLAHLLLQRRPHLRTLTGGGGTDTAPVTTFGASVGACMRHSIRCLFAVARAPIPAHSAHCPAPGTCPPPTRPAPTLRCFSTSLRALSSALPSRAAPSRSWLGSPLAAAAAAPHASM